MPVESFRDLIVWQRAIELTFAIYALTKTFPREEMFGLTSQLRRSAVSIPSNIAEGQSRATTGEFKQFLAIARGSNAEVQTQLVIARGLHYADPPAIARCENFCIEIAKMLNALLATLK
jgi:four helix bundle protein